MLDNVESFIKNYPALIALTGVIFGAIGWIWSSHRARVLQRRRISIDIILYMDKPYVNETIKSLGIVFRDNPTYNWQDLYDRVNNNNDDNAPSDEDVALYRHVSRILNLLEIISVFIETGATDPYLIKQCWKSFFIQTHKQLGVIIDCARRAHKNDQAFIHFETVAARWRKKWVFPIYRY